MYLKTSKNFLLFLLAKKKKKSYFSCCFYDTNMHNLAIPVGFFFLCWNNLSTKKCKKSASGVLLDHVTCNRSVFVCIADASLSLALT